MKGKRQTGTHAGRLGVLIAGAILASTAMAQSGAGSTSVARHAESSARHRASPYRPVNLTAGARNYYEVAWGIDNMLVHRTASGSLIRFSYRVTRPELAKAVSDDHSTAYLYDERSHALLHIPVLENVGKLRQTEAPEAGKEYWMVFSNKGDHVKAGDRVNVIIGNFHADGLKIE